jgi:hypothetical protein
MYKEKGLERTEAYKFLLSGVTAMGITNFPAGKRPTEVKWGLAPVVSSYAVMSASSILEM